MPREVPVKALAEFDITVKVLSVQKGESGLVPLMPPRTVAYSEDDHKRGDQQSPDGEPHRALLLRGLERDRKAVLGRCGALDDALLGGLQAATTAGEAQPDKVLHDEADKDEHVEQLEADAGEVDVPVRRSASALLGQPFRSRPHLPVCSDTPAPPAAAPDMPPPTPCRIRDRTSMTTKTMM